MILLTLTDCLSMWQVPRRQLHLSSVGGDHERSGEAVKERLTLCGRTCWKWSTLALKAA